MTLTSTTVKLQYNGDGSTVSFPITFVFWLNADIKAIHKDAAGTETTWTLGTQYTLTGGGGSTGTLTVETTPTNYTPASGETLTIKSTVPNKQTTSLPLGGALSSESLEERLDKNVRLIQQREEELNRTLLLSESSSFSSLTMPDPVSNKLIRWNSLLTGLENVDFIDIAGSPALPVDETDTNTDKNKTVSNSLAKGWEAKQSSNFLQSGTGAVSRTVNSKIGEDVSVKDFGAVGDGVTNDTVAIQAAIDAVNTAGGGVVFFPNGTYMISTTLELYVSNVWLRGQSRNSVTIKRLNSTEVTGEHIFMIGEGTLNAADHVRLSSLTIDGNQANQTPHTTHNIRIENATDVLIDDVESKNANYYGLHIRGEDATTRRITVRDCYIHDTRRDCLDVKNIGGFNNDIILDNVVCEAPGLDGTSVNDACFDLRGPMVASNLIAQVTGTRHHGIRIRGLDNGTVEGRMSLSNFQIVGNGSHTLDALLLVEGIESKISNGLVEAGGVEGVQIQGARTHLVNVESRANGGAGFWLRDNTTLIGERCKLVSCFAAANSGDGFDIDTDRNRFIACEARLNTLDGFDTISGALLNSFVGCESSGNSGSNWNDSGTSTMFSEYRTASATFTLSSGGNATVSFGTPFPNSVISVVASTEGDPITTAEDVRVDTLTTSNFAVRFRPNPGAVSRTIRYIAWGN